MGCGGILVMCCVLRVPRHLLVCGGERRLVVLTVDVINHGALGRICHREGIPPVLVVFHPGV